MASVNFAGYANTNDISTVDAKWDKTVGFYTTAAQGGVAVTGSGVGAGSGNLIAYSNGQLDSQTSEITIPPYIDLTGTISPGAHLHCSHNSAASQGKYSVVVNAPGGQNIVITVNGTNFFVIIGPVDPRSGIITLNISCVYNGATQVITGFINSAVTGLIKFGPYTDNLPFTGGIPGFKVNNNDAQAVATWNDGIFPAIAAATPGRKEKKKDAEAEDRKRNIYVPQMLKGETEAQKLARRIEQRIIAPEPEPELSAEPDLSLDLIALRVEISRATLAARIERERFEERKLGAKLKREAQSRIEIAKRRVVELRLALAEVEHRVAAESAAAASAQSAEEFDIAVITAMLSEI